MTRILTNDEIVHIRASYDAVSEASGVTIDALILAAAIGQIAPVIQELAQVISFEEAVEFNRRAAELADNELDGLGSMLNAVAGELVHELALSFQSFINRVDNSPELRAEAEAIAAEVYGIIDL